MINTMIQITRLTHKVKFERSGAYLDFITVKHGEFESAEKELLKKFDIWKVEVAPSHIYAITTSRNMNEEREPPSVDMKIIWEKGEGKDETNRSSLA